jgi:ABC-type sugar transport system permease subunit
MAQLQATRPATITIEGLDPSLHGMGVVESAEILRRWGARIAIIAALGLGWLLANWLPAIEMAGGESLSLDEVTDRLTAQGNGWVFTLVWFAGILTVISALVFPPSERFAQTMAVTVGAIVTMSGPYYVWSRLTQIEPDATGLGSGLVIAWVGCGLAAVCAWLAVLWWNRQAHLFERNWSKWMFLLPAIIWIMLMTAFPLVYAVTTSQYFFRSRRFAGTVGWDNFERLFIREPGAIWGHVGRALLWMAIVGAAVMLVTAAVAWLSDRRVTGEELRHGASLLPIATVPVALVYLSQTILRDPLDKQLGITFFFVAASVSIEMVLGFLLALLLNREMRARGFVRAIVTIPIFATPIAMGYLARIMFYEERGRGPINTIIGVDIPWLSSPTWARIATVIVDVWQWTPFVFIIALAGLQGLSHDILEAAQLDGASRFQLLRYIILPLMAPIL